MRAIFLAPLLLAAAFRFPDLAARPMHADEAIHADKFGTLLEGGGYVYDPSEYHGPTLYYMTLLPAWLRGESRYVEIDEVTLRLVPAILGVALVAAHVWARAFLGTAAAAVAALLVAISPAMVYYSRYFIHEVPLVFWSFGALLAACRFLREPGMGAAVLAGVCAGLMFATKETAPLALGCMAVAFALTRLLEPRYGESLPPIRVAVPGRQVLAALLAALLVSVVFFSSFLTHPAGIADAARAYAFYFDRAQAAWWHIHPWDYYLRLLIYFPSSGTPVWTEALILGLAGVGGTLGFTSKAVPGVDSRALRFLALYTVLMVGSYAAIPYKTPWCLLGFLQGMTLLAGAGAVFLVQACRGAVARALVVLLLSAAAAHLGFQAFASSFRFAADPRNPYVYAHTGMDVFEIAGRVMDLSRAHPDGSAMPVQFISGENLWPLPFYLRGLSRVTWANGVVDQSRSAPVIVVTPDMEPALTRKLYDLPPPGERELYVSIFEQPVELRPGVELRGYAAGSLWDEFRRLPADAPAPPGARRP